MSKIIQIQDINSSDTLKTMVEKINYNFDQIMAFGGGPKGEMGQRGFIGPDGEQGEQGERGNLITVVDDISTVGSDLKVGDIAIYSDNQYIYKVEEINGEKHFVSTNICIKGNAGESGTSNSPFKYSKEGDAIVTDKNEMSVPKYTFIGTDTTIDGHIGNLNVVGSDGIHIFTSTDNTGNDNGYCGKIYGDKLNSENILVLKGEDNPNNNYVKIDNTLLTDKIHSSNNEIKIAEITNNVIILGDKSNSTSIECNDFTIKNGSNTPIKTSSSGINLKGNLYVNDNDYKYTTKICGTSIELLSDYSGVSTNIKSNNTGVTISYNKDIRKNNAVNKDKNTLNPSTHSSSISINDIIKIQANETQINGNANVSGDVTAQVNNVSGVYLGCPIGTVVMWAGTKAPYGWKICNSDTIEMSANTTGSSPLGRLFVYYSIKIHKETVKFCTTNPVYFRVDNTYKEYEELINVIGGSYGFTVKVDGIDKANYSATKPADYDDAMDITSSTIKGYIHLPNLQQRFPLGAKNDNSWVCGQQTYNTILGSTGGEKSHNLTANESGLPSHEHSLNVALGDSGTSSGTKQEHSYSAVDGKGTLLKASSSGNTNAKSAHNNIPPFIAINFIIKYK